ncbi:hypothetical protein [Agathobacter ruminis]|uniref:Uncharacterized protein n=1 Tax=Agathobacter ruminis TaxID=1712665 RepID=A0A2G3E4R7_9FIRM|nr:hypothetical protein [Agathobacter ruminis]MDC7301280.1 hypothetical protein [Agathobacter ruminis]PHU38145.1 hypothetical protein CSX02_04515 [Agathobacter ruminis]
MRGIIKHDFVAGCAQFRRMILIAFLFFVGTLMAENNICYDSAHASVVESILYIFQGNYPLAEITDVSQLEMPILWIALQLFIAYIIGSYPLYDLKHYGINMLIRTRSKRLWWMGKVLWVIATVLVIYLIGYVVTFVAVALMGGSIFGVRSDIQMFLKVDYSIYSSLGLMMFCFIIPVLASITLSLLQLFLIIVFNEAIAFGTVGFLMLAGVFYDSAILFPCIAMGVRLSSYILSGGILKIMIGMIACSAVAIVAGAFVMKKKDVF